MFTPCLSRRRRYGIVTLVAGSVLVVLVAREGTVKGDTAAPPHKRSSAKRRACEAILSALAGDTESRDRKLHLALREDPDCELARWHLGQLRENGQWLTIDKIEQRMARDSQRQEYRHLRDKALDDPDRELDLARWCRDHELHDAEQLHLFRVLSNASTRPAVRKDAMHRLGLRPYRGMFLRQEQIDRFERQVEKQQQDLARWTPIIDKWRKMLESKQARRRQHAIEELRRVKDPSVISTLEKLMSSRGEGLALLVVSLLADMPEYQATESLVRHALDPRSARVRQAAMRQLKHRPIHQWAPLVLRRLVSPIQSRFYVNIGPDGLVRHQHEFFREGPQENFLLSASYVGGPQIVNTGTVNISGSRAPGPRGDAAREAVRRAAQIHREQLVEAAMIIRLVAIRESVRAMLTEHDVANTNQAIAWNNNRVFDVLEQTVGNILPRSATAWWEWWQDYNEVYRGDKPTYTRQVGVADPYYVPWTTVTLTSCFPAGTRVRTGAGLVDIEKVRAGDRVLSQDVETGELAYRLVLQTTVRPPSDLLRISLGNSSVTTTKGHPFWVNNLGWRMAKRLEQGQQVHTLHGGRTVGVIRPAPRAKAYNLVVADFATYFVGEAGLLVHDNTYRKPTMALTPGLLANCPIVPQITQ